MLYYKWYKKVEGDSTVIESTQSYFSDDNEYINEENGWTKNEDDYIEIEGEDDGEES